MSSDNWLMDSGAPTALLQMYQISPFVQNISVVMMFSMTDDCNNIPFTHIGYITRYTSFKKPFICFHNFLKPFFLIESSLGAIVLNFFGLLLLWRRIWTRGQHLSMTRVKEISMSGYFNSYPSTRYLLNSASNTHPLGMFHLVPPSRFDIDD